MVTSFSVFLLPLLFLPEVVLMRAFNARESHGGREGVKVDGGI